MSTAPDKALTDVADRIKSEAATASRAGQMAALDRLADDVQEGAHRLAAVTARADAAEARVARIEALLWMWEAGQSHLGTERGHWGPSSDALRAALADEETQEGPQEAFAAPVTGVQGEEAQ